MASRVWVLPLVVAVLLAAGPPAIGLVRAPASVGICPANPAADAILGDQNFCLISASPSAADFTGVVEVMPCSLGLFFLEKASTLKFSIVYENGKIVTFSKCSVLIVSIWLTLAKFFFKK